MNDNFIAQLWDYLFPKKNRLIATVAFVRTFGQTMAGVFTVGAGGLVVVSVNDIQAVDWNTVAWAAAALLLSAFLSGVKAFTDVSKNGLNSKYLEQLDTSAVIETIVAPLDFKAKTPVVTEPAVVEPAVVESVTEVVSELLAAAPPLTNIPQGKPQAPAVEEPA